MIFEFGTIIKILYKLNFIIEESIKKELGIMKFKAVRERKLIDLAKKLNSEGLIYLSC